MTKRERSLLESAMTDLRYDMDLIGDEESSDELKELADEELITVFETYLLTVKADGDLTEKLKTLDDETITVMKTYMPDIFEGEDAMRKCSNGGIHGAWKEEEVTRKCSNCKYRAFGSMFGVDYCLDYEMTCTEEDEIKAASDCPKYEEGTPACLERDYPSASNGDYGPSNPWDAPGMSVKDFI